MRLQFSSSSRWGRLCKTRRSSGSSARGEPSGLPWSSGDGEGGGEARRRGAACFSRMAAAAHALIGLVRQRPETIDTRVTTFVTLIFITRAAIGRTSF